MELEELILKYQTALATDKTMCEKLNADMESYKNMLTTPLDLRGLDLKPLSESDQCKVYQLRINSFKAKLEVTTDILKAIRDGDEELVKELDFFGKNEDEKRWYKSSKEAERN